MKLFKPVNLCQGCSSAVRYFFTDGLIYNSELQFGEPPLTIINPNLGHTKYVFPLRADFSGKVNL